MADEADPDVVLVRIARFSNRNVPELQHTINKHSTTTGI